jgi:hypothetical protein
MLRCVVWYKFTDVSEEPCCLAYDAEYGSSTLLRTIGKLLPDYTA